MTTSSGPKWANTANEAQRAQGEIVGYTPKDDHQPPGESAPLSDTEKKALLDETQQKLDRLEAKTVPGAPVRTPKSRILDATEYEKAHPENYVRYASTTVPGKMDARAEEGFSRVDLAEAAKHNVRVEVGPMVLTEQPRKLHEERVARQKARNKELLEAHNREVEAVAEAVVRQLRDQHGIDVPIERILVKD